MTTLEIIKLTAEIQIGTRVACNKKSILRVVGIDKNGFNCVNEYAESKGIESKAIIPFEYLLNPHYNGSYKIVK